MADGDDPGGARPAADAAARRAAEVLALHGVGVRRGGTAILSGVDWTVQAGERWVVVGPNGAGKSTLLAVAAMTLFPSTGTVRILGAELGTTDARALRPRIGLASALLAGRLEPGQAARDVVVAGRTGALAPWWDRVAAADLARAEELLAGLGVGGLAGRPFATLSTGERQRVLLARTLLPDPELVLVDEPAAGLDLRAREELVEALGAMAAAPRPAAVVLVTHHLEEIPPGFGHALVLAAGQVVAAGPIGSALTGAALTPAYGIPLRIDHAAGRWTARRA